MIYSYTNSEQEGTIRLIKGESELSRNYYKQQVGDTFHSIAWNIGKSQKILIDEIEYQFESNSILPLTLNQSFSFELPENIVLWQFNREFYCIANHDKEVGCVGFIFFGPSPTMFIELDTTDREKMSRILDQFEEEFVSDEDIKGEMLRILLVRLIIKITRIAKKQYVDLDQYEDGKFDLVRQYNLLVEIHFRVEHQVNFYAKQLHKSPKTISNYFSILSKKTPLQIIHDRIITEAKRLFYYTNKSVKEIASELGFDEVSHFSTFFKKVTFQSPTQLKNALKKQD